MRPRSNFSAAARATARWPRCTGSKVPPKRATLMRILSTLPFLERNPLGDARGALGLCQRGFRRFGFYRFGFPGFGFPNSGFRGGAAASFFARGRPAVHILSGANLRDVFTQSVL